MRQKIKVLTTALLLDELVKSDAMKVLARMLEKRPDLSDKEKYVIAKLMLLLAMKI